MTSDRSSTPPNDERLFLRDVVSKPFDAVTALEFMALWGIASRAVALSESARSDEAGVLDALAVNSGYQRWWIHAGRLHFERDGQPGRIEVMLPHSCTVQSAIGAVLPEEPTPEMIASVGTILQPYAAKLVWKRMLETATKNATDRHLDKNVPSTKATVK